jgi:hypothetical protein
MNSQKMRFVSFQPEKEGAEVISLCHKSVKSFVLDNEVEEYKTEAEAVEALRNYVRNNPGIRVVGKASREALA